jgi:hypothetical protein
MSRLYAACLCVLLPSVAWGQERTEETFRAVAGRMVQAINAADYEGIRKDFNKGMLEAFPVERCRTFFSKEISGEYGKINKLEPPQFKSAAKAVFVAHCEDGTLDFTLVLDHQGRVAGMTFRPPWYERLIGATIIGALAIPLFSLMSSRIPGPSFVRVLWVTLLALSCAAAVFVGPKAASLDAHGGGTG